MTPHPAGASLELSIRQAMQKQKEHFEFIEGTSLEAVLEDCRASQP